MPRYRLVVEPAALVCSRLRAAIAGRGIKSSATPAYDRLEVAAGCSCLTGPSIAGSTKKVQTSV